MTRDPRQQYSESEVARRRDEVIKQMLNTPPQPRLVRAKKRKERPATKGRVHRAKSRA